MASIKSLLLAVAAAVPALASDYPIVNVYWGQRGVGDRLIDYCKSSGVDTVTLAFVNVSPENAGGSGYPGTNFAAHCSDEVFIKDGVPTKLLSGCYQIKEDIPKCQALGKKVLISIGGVYNTNSLYSISTPENGRAFGAFMWSAFGPYEQGWNGPRPFDLPGSHVSLDGFDFDIEFKFVDQTPWIAMVNYLRGKIRASGLDIILTAAPQCRLDDPYIQMRDLMKASQFDRFFIQFYNNVDCPSLDQWYDFIKTTPSANAKLHIGLLASVDAGGLGYLGPDDAIAWLCKYANKDYFGGVSLWDGNFGSKNKVKNETFYELLMDGLTECGPARPKPTTTSATTVSSTSSTSTSKSTSSIPTTTSTTKTTSTRSSTITSTTKTSTTSTSSTSSTASSTTTSATKTSTTKSSSSVSTSTTSSASSSSSSSSTKSSNSISTSTTSSASSSSLSSSTKSSSSVSTSTTSSASSSSSSSSTESASSSTTSTTSSSVSSTSLSSTSQTSDTSSPTLTETQSSTETSSTETSSTETSSTYQTTSTHETTKSVTTATETSATSTKDITTKESSTATVTSTSEMTSSATSTSEVEQTTSTSRTISETSTISETTTKGHSTTSASTSETSASPTSTEVTTTIPSLTTSTIRTTAVYTITSCAPTVTNCPVGSVTTSIIDLYTTVCPVTSSGHSSATYSHQPSQATSASEATGISMTTSTIYTTSVYTVTSCPPSVPSASCPAHLGSVTTEVVAVATTVCPVSASTSPASPAVPVLSSTSAAASPTHPSGSGSGAGNNGNNSGNGGAHEVPTSITSSVKIFGSTATANTLTRQTTVVVHPLPTGSTGAAANSTGNAAGCFGRGCTGNGASATPSAVLVSGAAVRIGGGVVVTAVAWIVGMFFVI